MTLLPAFHRVIVGLVQLALHRKVLPLVTVVICAIFAAKTVSSLIEAEVLVPSASAATRPVVTHAPPAPTAPKLDSAVLTERNIFCSSCEPERSYTGYTGQDIVLIATSVSEASSRATLRVVGTDVQGSWGLDDKIPGVGRITRIGGASIDVVDDGNHLKKISLLDSVAGPGTGAATPSAGPATPTDPFASRIHKLGDGSYEVDRDVVRELVASAGRGAGARAVPVMDKGQIAGIRLFGVRPTSAAGAIGLRNGDTLQAIDGDKIKTAQQLLDLFGKLESMKSLELQGTRAGKPLAVSLKFR